MSATCSRCGTHLAYTEYPLMECPVCTKRTKSSRIAVFLADIEALEAENAELRRKLTSTEMARKVECDAKFKCWDFIRDHGLGAEFYALTHFAFAKGCAAPSPDATEES